MTSRRRTADSGREPSGRAGSSTFVSSVFTRHSGGDRSRHDPLTDRRPRAYERRRASAGLPGGAEPIRCACALGPAPGRSHYNPQDASGPANPSETDQSASAQRVASFKCLAGIRACSSLAARAEVSGAEVCGDRARRGRRRGYPCGTRPRAARSPAWPAPGPPQPAGGRELPGQRSTATVPSLRAGVRFSAPSPQPGGPLLPQLRVAAPGVRSAQGGLRRRPRLPHRLTPALPPRRDFLSCVRGPRARRRPVSLWPAGEAQMAVPEEEGRAGCAARPSGRSACPLLPSVPCSLETRAPVFRRVLLHARPPAPRVSFWLSLVSTSCVGSWGLRECVS